MQLRCTKSPCESNRCLYDCLIHFLNKNYTDLLLCLALNSHRAKKKEIRKQKLHKNEKEKNKTNTSKNMLTNLEMVDQVVVVVRGCLCVGNYLELVLNVKR